MEGKIARAGLNERRCRLRPSSLQRWELVVFGSSLPKV